MHELGRADVAGTPPGDYEGAARIFRALAQKTDSPRIRLELARALFFLRQYEESRTLFREVALEPELPWRVRDNIEGFLRAIDDVDRLATMFVQYLNSNVGGGGGGGEGEG